MATRLLPSRCFVYLVKKLQSIEHDGAHQVDSLSDSENNLSAEASVLEKSNPYELDLTTFLRYLIIYWLCHYSELSHQEIRRTIA
ncbi:uncharacterized protein B0T23DRAFT_386132 [Neurospora hispaniola]|uniref:Uncharacterized protein n=1 Tax=Neurospora hispaniola TaxID=588809 RepID=A0AAJ0I208_9PEZI|nr:hypothetical protein B0T23DRAFT_386132 [Neurospora hispaniola]